MRVVQVNGDGALEFNYMWLPTFIGQNFLVMKELERFWKETYPDGLVYDDKALDDMHDLTVDWLCGKFKIDGLREYLEGIEKVKES